MLKLQVKSIKKETSVETSERYLDVEIEILNDDEVLAVRKLGFPIDMDEKDLKKELKKYFDNFKNELKMAEKQKDIDKQDENADNVISKLSDLTL